MNYSKKITIVTLAGFYLSGILLWGIFFSWGNFPYDFHDWAEVNMPRLAAVQDAVQKNTLPLQFQIGNVLRCGSGCDRFFSAIDGIISPDVIFLKWLPVGPWTLLHVWLLYTAGFAGMLALRRRFNLSLPLFAMAFLLFFFNGHLLAHLSVGHLTWGGYFLFPWLVYLVDRFIQGDGSWAWVLWVALLLFFIYLQGSFHQFVWSLIFLGFLSLAYIRRFFTVFKALAAACLVSSVRILPTALSYGKFKREFSGGYPDLVSLYISLTHWVTPAEALPNTHIATNLGYWEFDFFIGKVGLLFLLLAGLAWLALQIRDRKVAWVLVPIGALFLLSYRDLYAWFEKLPIPLLYGEQVTTRLISLAFAFFVFLSTAALQKWAGKLGRWKWLFEAGIAAWAVYQAVVLVPRVLAWRVSAAYQSFVHTPVDLAQYTVNNHADPQYFAALGGGLLLTLLTIAALAWLAARERAARRAKTAQERPETSSAV